MIHILVIDTDTLEKRDIEDILTNDEWSHVYIISTCDKKHNYSNPVYKLDLRTLTSTYFRMIQIPLYSNPYKIVYKFLLETHKEDPICFLTGERNTKILKQVSNNNLHVRIITPVEENDSSSSSSSSSEDEGEHCEHGVPLAPGREDENTMMTSLKAFMDTPQCQNLIMSVLSGNNNNET